MEELVLVFIVAMYLIFNRDIPFNEDRRGVDLVHVKTKKKKPGKNFFKENLYRENPREQKSGSISETACRMIFQSYTGKFFHSVRPEFLRSPRTNRCLELDGYNEELRLAFEYNGIQHYEFPNRFHRTIDEFKIQQENDRFKEARCRELGIDLIVIPYTVKDLERFIREKLEERRVIQK